MKEEHNDAFIDSLIRTVRIENIFGIAGCLAGVAGGIALAVYGDMVRNSIWLQILGLVICIIFGIISCILIWWGSYDYLKDIVKEEITAGELEEVFENVVYEPDEHIDGRMILTTEMGFTTDHVEEIEGSDRIRASYHGTDFEASDIEIFYKSAISRPHSRKRIVFKGIWLISSCGERLPSDVLISENKKKKMVLSGKKFTDSPEFNKWFTVSAEEEAAARLLTPKWIEKMLEIRKNAGGRVYFRFQKNGKVHIAVDSGTDSFEIETVPKQNCRKLKKRIKNEVNNIVEIMKDLTM